MKEMVGGCCVCSDDRGWPENPLVYCDGQSCTVAVHQACYGIVTVPTGPWYCRKCESQERSVKVKCELCPSKYGALKRTDNSGWAHVVCALYIPEVRFGNVTTMEPIQLQLIPQERFNKVCYICEENGKPANASVGACMQCNKSGCKQQFHVTCAQSLGLLCEEAGNYLDNVKYCGYCQHHYSKLKKGGNVKTIPPYKPVATENQQSDSSSEKEPAADPLLAAKGGAGPGSLGKRKSSGASKSVGNKVANAKSAPSYQKQVSGGGASKVPDKGGKTSGSAKSAKSTDDSAVSADSAEKTAEVEKEIGKDNGGKGKKRKANSRTPTPNIVSEGGNQGAVVESTPPPPVAPVNSKKESPVRTETIEKPKKAKTESSQQPSPPTTGSPQTTAATSTASVSAPTTRTASPATAETVQTTAAVAAVPATTTATSAPAVVYPQTPQVNSVVVSVPLHNTSLSPHSVIPASNPAAAVVLPPPQPQALEERKQVPATPNPPSPPVDEESMITSEMSGGGLKITYEKQPQQQQQVVPMEIEEMVPAPVVQLPSKRASRSQSTDKNEKSTRSRKKNSNGLMNSLANVVTTSKRSSRSQHNTPPPQPSSFAGISQSGAIKDSPPSSPSSESLGAPPTMGRKKGRKSAPASVSGSSANREKDTKDNIKLFQNGVNAPHMLGNQLNLNSNMAQKMSDHLNSEMEAHSIFNSGESSSNLMGPQLHHRVIASARSSSAGGSSTASGGSGLSSMLGGSGGPIPQTLDQLLERQWEQGSQFLMEQAQHFDIASLLSCLHQLRAENLRLEEHVSSLLQRRDHLLAVNARLAIPLTGTPASSQSAHPHTVNNIHPSVGVTHAETSSRSRHSGGGYSSHVQPVSQHQSVAIENGISPTEQPYPHPPHRSPATNPTQPSPNIRQSSGGYSGLMRGNTESSSGRSAPRPPSYSMYQGPPNTQQQMVIRRDAEQQHTNPPKPS